MHVDVSQILPFTQRGTGSRLRKLREWDIHELQSKPHVHLFVE